MGVGKEVGGGGGGGGGGTSNGIDTAELLKNSLLYPITLYGAMAKTPNN